jgi:ribosome-binding ATPase
MGLNCGIIGLPNVGKSTIFSALSGANAHIANYPFCTIEPNRGIVPVPDERLMRIAGVLKKNSPIQTRIEFIDVAGLVKGASTGEGLGNRFLGNIRNVDALVHVVRCFNAGDVVHVTGEMDPVRDAEIVNTELMIADLEVLERAGEKLRKQLKSGEKEAKGKLEMIQRFTAFLNEGRPLRKMGVDDETDASVREYGLITLKPVLYLANVDEGGIDGAAAKELREYAERDSSVFLAVVGRIEEEISHLAAEEKREYLEAMGIKESGLTQLIQSAYRLLNLLTFYTAATDLQAWTVQKGTSAAAAAGKIHSDFERGFIRAEVYGSDDLFRAGSDHQVREMGLLRVEGRDYIVQEGDIIKFLFNV